MLFNILRKLDKKKIYNNIFIGSYIILSLSICMDKKIIIRKYYPNIYYK